MLSPNPLREAVEKRDALDLSERAWMTALLLAVLPSSVTALAHPTKRDSREDAFSVLDGWDVFGTVSWDLVLRVLEFHEKGLITLHDEVPSQEEGAEHHP